MARIPRPGRIFANPNPEMLERQMKSLVVTTSVVRQRTCIPVPAVRGWSASDENEAGSAYMFFDYVSGRSLGDCFHTLPPEKIVNIIYEWALYTWELTRLQFPAMGCLGLSNEGDLGVGKYMSCGSVEEGRDTIRPIYRGPWTSVTDYLFGISYLKKCAPQDEASYNRFSFGTYLESLIPFAVKQEWNKGPFVLCHDDLNVQNILVDPSTGHITAILDWDYAAVKPLQSLLAYPESLRWDILDPYYRRFSDYQQQWSQCYRPLYREALMFAADRSNTGIHIESSKLAEILEDSTFYSELERGLSESWRESEAMMFCNGYVYGDLSRDVLKCAARGITAGTWMTTHGTRAGFKPPKKTQSNCKRSGVVAKVKASIKKKKTSVQEGGVSTKPTKRSCNWTSFREKLRQRKKTRQVVEALCDKSEDNQKLNPGTEESENKRPVRKRRGWWGFLFRRFYGRRKGQ